MKTKSGLRPWPHLSEGSWTRSTVRLSGTNNECVCNLDAISAATWAAAGHVSCCRRARQLLPPSTSVVASTNVKGVAQAIADEVEARDGSRDGGARNDRQPGGRA